MCRFLVLRSSREFDPSPIMSDFKERCRRSSEYQGHGFGVTLRASGLWERRRCLAPIWEDTEALPAGVDVLMVHARSAFRNEGIDIENNMPFYRGDLSFVFNGEIRGIRLKAPGRIGAEKLFHLILERQRSGLPDAIGAVDRLVRSRSQYVRAMNVAITDGSAIYAHCRFSERPDYFTLHFREGDLGGVSSEPLDGSFRPMENGETRVIG
jgi:predicted glutamine amidotransferase